MSEKIRVAVKTGKSPYEDYTEKQIRAAFEVFDEDRNGRAKLKHLGTILRALGRVISTAELREIQEKIEDREFPKYMRLEDLLPVASKVLINDSFKSASKQALLKSFAILDREGRGCVDADSMRRIFKDYGHDFEDDFMDRFISDAVKPGTKYIYYKEYCDKLVAPPFFDVEDNRRKIRLELTRENSRIT